MSSDASEFPDHNLLTITQFVEVVLRVFAFGSWQLLVFQRIAFFGA